MSEAAAESRPRPVISYLKIPDEGDPHLEGNRCKQCRAIFLSQPTACPSCSSRNGFEALRLADTGTLHVYSIVHRSFPGIETPYISAIVDLDGGGTVKGNLIEIEPNPEKLQMGMAVEVVYRVAPRKDKEGNEYLTYYFRPRSAG